MSKKPVAKAPQSPGRQKTNTAADNAVWTETIRKERSMQGLNENFDVNPKNMFLLTEKITRVAPTQLVSSETNTSAEIETLRKDALVDGILRDRIKKSLQDPREKYEYPITQQHEYGWFAEHTHRENKWTQVRSSSDVTKYADLYYADQGKSPFAQIPGQNTRPKASKK